MSDVISDILTGVDFITDREEAHSFKYGVFTFAIVFSPFLCRTMTFLKKLYEAERPPLLQLLVHFPLIECLR